MTQRQLTRAEKATNHEEAQRDRVAAVEELRVSFKRIQNEPAFINILKKCDDLILYHDRVAKDGIGSRATGALDKQGQPVTDIVYLTGEQRLKEVDRSVGIEEIKDYITRNLNASLVDLANVGENDDQEDDDDIHDETSGAPGEYVEPIS